MSEKIKLGWVVSEEIGVAIVNTRGINSMKARPRYFFHNENGSIDIRPYSIEINGTIEGAAIAFSEDILDRTKTVSTENLPHVMKYFEVMKVLLVKNIYSLELLPQGVGIIDPDVWSTLKKKVEKICNNLILFI